MIPKRVKQFYINATDRMNNNELLLNIIINHHEETEDKLIKFFKK